jgi:hypothetical protein
MAARDGMAGRYPMILGRAPPTSATDNVVSSPRSRAVAGSPGPSAAGLASGARWALAGSTLVTLALFLTPSLHTIAYPLVLLSTLVHEMGHGVGALLSGGTWHDFKMFSDGSGVAHIAPTSHFGVAFACAAGLVGPALIAAVYLGMGLRPKLARLGLGVTGAFFALSLLLWVRGGFGMTFVAVLAGGCLAIALLASPEVARLVLVFLATQLALSVFSRGDYLFMDYVSGQMSGARRTPADVKIMELAIGGPYWFWGIVCGAFSVIVLLVAAWLYIRPARRA